MRTKISDNLQIHSLFSQETFVQKVQCKR